MNLRHSRPARGLRSGTAPYGLICLVAILTNLITILSFVHADEKTPGKPIPPRAGVPSVHVSTFRQQVRTNYTTDDGLPEGPIHQLAFDQQLFGKTDQVKIQAVNSPLQNPALDYKSSFSRAVELKFPTHRNLLISGTASIDPVGKTAHPDNPEKQIRLTMEVVKAILESRNMDWGDLFRGIAYFKDMNYLPIYCRVAEELGIPRFPLAVSHADVCRDDLLFEIEVDAVKIA